MFEEMEEDGNQQRSAMHMRPHGINSDFNIPNYGEPPPITNKHTYLLRTTSNRFISCRSRGGCCKKSFTWSLMNHVKFTNHDDDDNLSFPQQELKDRGGETKNGYNVSVDRNVGSSDPQDQDLANCLVMLSNNSSSFATSNNNEEKLKTEAKFQCKACEKVFNSHQALGGHRASHKKVKGCYAARLDCNFEDDNIPTDDEHPVRGPQPTVPKKKGKVHACSICHRVFSSGQALGGHNRCHWLSSNLPHNANLHDHKKKLDQNKQINKKPIFEKLDLNHSPVVDGTAEVNEDNNPVKFEGRTRIYLQSRSNEGFSEMKIQHQHQNYMHGSTNEEEGTTKKLAKLSDLREMDVDGERFTWLQMGITSTNAQLRGTNS